MINSRLYADILSENSRFLNFEFNHDEIIMGKYRIEYQRSGCIGAGVCAALADKHWVMADDGKADLVGSHKEGDLHILEVDEIDLECNKQAAEGCPANIIHIIDKETGKKII